MPEIDRLIVTLQANLNRYNADMARGQQITNQRLAAMEARYAMFSRNVRASTASAAGGLGTALGGLAAYLGTRQIKAYADSWTRVTRTLESSEEIFGLRLRSAAEMNKLANETRQENESLVKLYVRTAAATRELGTSEEDVAKATTTVSKALKLGSASASEQTSTMLQLSQALQKGKLDGDEFRSVMENAGVIQELLADKLRVSKGEIVRMAAAGQLKVPQLVAALVEGADKVDRIFAKMPATIEESFTVLENSTEEYIGSLNKVYGVTEKVVGATTSMAENIEEVGDSAIVVATALLAAFSPKILSRIALFGGGILAAAGPVGIVAGGLAGATAAADLFGDEMSFNLDLITQAIDQGADFGTAWTRAFSEVGSEGQTMQDTMRATLQVIAEETNRVITTVLPMLTDAVGVNTQTAMAEIRQVVNLFIGSIVTGVKVVIATLTTVPQTVAEKIIDAVNAVLRGIQSMIDKAIDGINEVVELANKVPGVELDFFTAPDLGQVKNDFKGAGETAATAFGDAFSNLTRDYIGEAGAAMRSTLDRVSERAKEIALQRRFLEGTSVNKPIDAKETFAQPEDAEASKARDKFEKVLQRIRDQITFEEMAANAVGKTAIETEKLAIQQELLNAARDAGHSLTANDIEQVALLSDALARAQVETEELRSAFSLIEDETKSFLTGVIKGFRDGASASEILSDALTRISDKLIDMAVNNLVEAALGGLLDAGGGGSGGAGIGQSLLKLFAFKEGGVMTSSGPRALPRFAKGGVSNEAAIFGEAGPEAAVPLPDGRRIPVDLNIPNVPTTAQTVTNMQVTVAPVFNVENGSSEGVDKMQKDVVPELKSLIQNEVGELFSRRGRFAKAKI